MKNNKNTPLILGSILVILFYFIVSYLRIFFHVPIQLIYLYFLLLISPILYIWRYQKIKRKDIFIYLTLLLILVPLILFVIELVNASIMNKYPLFSLVYETSRGLSGV